MSKKTLVKITQKQISDVLVLLPSPAQKLIGRNITSDNKVVRDNAIGDIKRASYFSETGLIIVHGFTIDEIKRFEYVDVILHEVAHKIFRELLTKKQLAEWSESREKESFIIKLDDIYPLERIWEEEFSIFFSYLYLMYFLEGQNMKQQAKKIQNALGKMPQRLKTVETISKNLRQSSDGCFQKVHKRMRRAVFGNEKKVPF